jgi:hypothetical protein
VKLPPISRLTKWRPARRIALHIVPLAAVTDIALVVLGNASAPTATCCSPRPHAARAVGAPSPARRGLGARRGGGPQGALSVGVGRALDSVFVNRASPPRAVSAARG